MSGERDRDTAVFSALSHLECSRDGSRHDADVVQGTSPIGRAAARPVRPRPGRRDRHAATEIAGAAAGPVALPRAAAGPGPRAVVTLGEGMTPLLALPRHGARLGVPGGCG